MLTRLKLLRLQREMMETREKKMFEMRGKTISDPRENLKEENMTVTAHVGNIQSIFIFEPGCFSDRNPTFPKHNLPAETTRTQLDNRS